MSATLEVAVDRETEQCSTTAEFWVGGERYSLGPADIHSVYPPEGSRGHFERTIPHIALSRDTLPWEREPGVANAPWLALLLLREEEVARTPLATMTLGAYRAACPSKPELEPGQQDSDQVQVITLDPALSKLLIPRFFELPVLSHVRGQVAGDQLREGVAMVLSQRLPQKGKNTLHLVSLEGRYASQTFDRVDQSCTLVSLKSWSFYCEEDAPQPQKPLARIFGELNTAWLMLPSTGVADDLVSRGRTPLPHHFRSGELGASWYAGPLVPGTAPQEEVPLPASSADALLDYHEKLGMFDVTYAAAWELGRLLAMENRTTRTALASWRRSRVLLSHHQRAAEGEHKHLPQIERTSNEYLSFGSAALIAWLKALRSLEGVPSRYLLPNEKMLPPESLRVFKADVRWLDALLDGALSLARLPRTTRTPEDQAAEDQLRIEVKAADWVSGFLLRSEVVSGWPGLVIEAKDRSQKVIVPQHRIELSPSISMCLFGDLVSAVSIRQHRDTLHLALQDSAGPSAWNNQNERVMRIDPRWSSSEFARNHLHHAEAMEIEVAW